MDCNNYKQVKMKYRPLLILLEGLDCSGKKTTGRLLQKRLSEIGIATHLNIGALTSKAYRSISTFVSLHNCPNIIRSLVYSFDGYGDHLWYKNFGEQIVIQISSPMRNWAYALMNKQYLRILMMRFLKKQIANYDIIWYLTAPYKLRIHRHKYQVEKQENFDNLKKRFKSEEIFYMHETCLTNILNINKVFDTELCNCDEIVNYMINYILTSYVTIHSPHNDS